MNTFQAILIAIVEGLTEFLPVSSTGHMIIASSLMGIADNDFVKLYIVHIQLGAILSVVVLYWKRFFQSLDFYYRLLVAFIPAAILGFLFNDFIDSLLENIIVVAFMLLIGGIILIFIDKLLENKQKEESETYPKMLLVGLFQCLAMIPGVSRSAATIIGGMLQGWTRQKAAEFSFFLAVPTMFAASAYKLLKTYDQIKTEDFYILGIGNLVAFVVGMLAIRFFIGFLSKYGFKVFGYYRIALGLFIITLWVSGVQLKIP